MIFKKLLLLLPILLLTGSLHGQKMQEFGLTLSSFDSFGVIYKKQLKKETRYLRVSGANVNYLSFGSDVLNIQIGASVGWENRKALNKKFKFIHGFEIGTAIGFGNLSNDLILQVAPSVGYILGGQYQLNDDFYVNLEIVPRVQATFFTLDAPIIQINGNSNLATLSIVYMIKRDDSL